MCRSSYRNNSSTFATKTVVYPSPLPPPLNATPWLGIFGLTKGILLTPKTTITERGGTRAVEGKLNMSPVEVLVNLWRHECERVFCDKLTTNKVF